MKFEAVSVGVNVARLLLDPSTAFELLPNPLAFECILRNKPDRLKKLSKEDLSVDVANGIYALHYAAALGAVDCFAVLIKRLSVSVDSQLLYCCDARFPFGNRLGVLDLLREQGNLSLAEHKAGLKNMLESAAYNGVEWMISYLLAHFDGLDRSSRGVALMAASFKDHVDCWRLLIDSGAEVNVQMPDGRTALMLASVMGHSDCCRRLIESGADVNLQTVKGNTALIFASFFGHVDCCRLLIESGVEVNEQMPDGRTALMHASYKGHSDCCRLLIESGANVNLQMNDGATAFSHASREGHADCCRLLMESSE